MYNTKIMKKLLLFCFALMLSFNIVSQKVWDGSSSTDWNTGSNWANGEVPLVFNTIGIEIPDVANDPVMTEVNQTISGSLTIATGATLTLTTSSINQGGTTDNDGTVILNSGSAFISNANVTGDGNFKYNRELEVANVFYAMGSPFAGQDIDALITAEPIPQSSTNNNMGIGEYNTSSNDYSYIQSGASSSGAFLRGQGYLVRVNATGDVSFTGSNPTVDDVGVTLTYTGSTRYNLVSNPYPAHLKTDNSGGLLASNSSKVDQTVYIWNANDATFETGVAVDGFIIAPGQGFFVKAKSSGSGDFIFKSSYTIANSGDSFRSFEDRFEVHLNISDESINRLAKVYYIAETTTGYDDGYDGELFTSQNNDFTIYTSSESDENSSGLDLAIQSIPEMTYVVPVGVNALEGTEFTISATTLNRPEGYNVYLEDRDNNTFTLLDETSDFRTTTSSDLNGTGRFYLHTTASTMSNEQAITNLLNVFKLDRNNFITIQGLSAQTSETNVKLYSILGREVLSTTLDNNSNSQSISTVGLSAGIYVIKLESANNFITKKLIIK